MPTAEGVAAHLVIDGDVGAPEQCSTSRTLPRHRMNRGKKQAG